MIGNIKNNKGFSLIEVVLATGIFLIIFVLIVDLAITFGRTPMDLIYQKKLETEADYLIEKITQAIRTSAIDYDRYEDEGIDLSDSANNPENYIYLINSEGVQTKIYEDVAYGDALIEMDINYPDGSDDLDVEVSSSTFIVDNFELYIYPYLNPYCENYEVVAGSLTYAACSSDEQPRVVISMQVHMKQDEDAEFNIQTTVSSRIYER